MTKFLTALPVFNEERHVDAVLDEVVKYSPHVVVIDDGSTDGTAMLLANRDDITVVTHVENQGYGAALRTAFEYAIDQDFDVLVTIDCDGQHEPQRIPEFVAANRQADIVSGSRYLKQFDGDSEPPQERKGINMQITAEINRRLGLSLTDAFCGFKAYRVEVLDKLLVEETGYGMPLVVWVQAAAHRLTIRELAVPLVYLEEKRSFGGALDDGGTRLNYYHELLESSIAAVEQGHGCSEILCGGGAG